MPEYTITTTAPTEDDHETVTHHTTWPGTAAELAAHHGAQLGATYRGWHHADWTVTVTAADGTITTTHTHRDEDARVQAHHAIIQRWETARREHRSRIETTCADLDSTIRQAQIDGIDAMLRADAVADLAGLGYQVVGEMFPRIVDERTTEGMLTLIAHAERQRADHKHDVGHWEETRDDLIRSAHALGTRPARLADAARVTPARIHQIRSASGKS